MKRDQNSQLDAKKAKVALRTTKWKLHEKIQKHA